MKDEFISSYSRLNAEQKQAVDYIDGPLLVLAGPGTGKTELLSLRVANILKQTDTDATNIICLTFTNSAANNMQLRLNKLIGSSAYSVNIKTFHSFAAEIMQSYPEYFWNGANLTIVPDALQLETITKVLDQLPLSNPLTSKFQGSYTALRDIQEGLKLAKEAGLTPAKLKAMIEANVAYLDEIEKDIVSILSDKLSIKKLDEIKTKISSLPDQNIAVDILPLRALSETLKESLGKAIELDHGSGNLKNVSKWKSSWIQVVDKKPGLYRERRRNAWWLALADLYDKYRNQLHSIGFYDYSDMIVEVISQLEQNPELLALVQERFEYVLIDEFQDTNAAQFRLAHLVANHYGSEGKPNIMAVGDDDQTIYAFNGAELNNMLEFISSYEDVKVISLNVNYRSHQEILNFSEKIISLSTQRVKNKIEGANKPLKSARAEKLSELIHISYPSQQHQLNMIADKISRDRKEHKDQSIAVLARSHASLVRLSSILLSKGVNVSYEKQNNILDNDLIKEVILITKVLESITNGDEQNLNVNLSKLLSYPSWGISPKEYFSLALSSNKKKDNWLEAMSTSSSALKDYSKWLLWLGDTSAHENINIIIEYILGLKTSKYLTSPLKKYYLDSNKPDNIYLESLSALNVLLSLVRNYAAATKGQTTIHDFLGYIDINDQTNQHITDQSWFSTSDHSVQLMTVHKAKGLEFDRVYLIDAINNEWRPRNKRLSSPSNLPLQPYGEDFDDYIRLSYVATTRSKVAFIVSSYQFSAEGENIIPSPLFSEMKLIQEGSKTSSNQKIDLLENSISWPELYSDNIKELIKPRLIDFQLSSTALNTYLDIINSGPEEFYLRHIFKLPTTTTADMAFGIAVHSALDTAQKQINTGKYSLKKILDVFNEVLSKQAITKDDEIRYLKKGEEFLPKLLNNKSILFGSGGQSEVNISDIKLSNGARITGKLDSINVTGNTLLITDFKTGKALKNFSSKAKDKSEKIWRNKNQLLFYTLLIKNSPKYRAIKNISTRIIYVEAENDDELILEFEPQQQELDRLSQTIETVYKNIVNYKQINTLRYPKTLEGINTFIDDLLKSS